MLWGLLLVAIPIIIHLFSFRRTTVVKFSTTRFLRELKEETNRRSRLKHLLVLISRCLAIAAIVLAFAQPFFSDGLSSNDYKQRVVSVYVDNSFSMDGLAEEGSLLEQSKEIARGLAGEYKATDQFQLLSNRFSGKEQRLLSREEFYSAIDEISIGAQTRVLSSIIRRQNDALSKGEGENIRILISDFQENMVDLESLENDSINTFLLKITNLEQSNLYIDSCWFDNPVLQKGQNAKLVYRLVNGGSQNAENVRLILRVNGQQKGLANPDVESGSSVTDTLTFEINKEGWNSAALSISDHPITFDDNYYFSYEVLHELPVLVLLDGSNNYIRALFRNETFINAEFADYEKVDYGRIKGYKTIILSDASELSSGLIAELTKSVDNGANLVVFPKAEMRVKSFSSLFASLAMPGFATKLRGDFECRRLNMNEALFKEVFKSVPRNLDLPSLNSYFKIPKLSTSRSVDLMTLNNGDPMLTKNDFGGGSIYLSAVNLGSMSNFPKHALFVPVMHRICMMSARSLPLTLKIGTSENIRVPISPNDLDPVFELKGENSSFIPEIDDRSGQLRLSIGDQITKDGYYELRSRKIADSILAIVSLNYNRSESPMKFMSEESLRTLTEENQWQLYKPSNALLAGNMLDASKDSNFWRWLIAAALFFLLIEMLLIRILK